ncbi:hypothetical protein GQ457_12G031250 [Hibiscus cannabinus]
MVKEQVKLWEALVEVMSKDVCGTILGGSFSAIRNRGERSDCREVYVEAALIMHLLFCIPKRRDGVLNPLSLSMCGYKMRNVGRRLKISLDTVVILSRIKELERKINNLEEEGNDGVIDFDKLEELKEYKLELWELLKLKEDLLRQQARAKWLSKGDTISAYFHRVVKVRAKRGLITKLMFGERWLEDPKILKKMVFSHFKKHYDCEIRDLRAVLNLNSKRLTEAESLNLEKSFSLEEIKEAIWCCDDTKAPTPDSFNLKSFKIYWEVLKQDLLKTFSVLVVVA